MGNRKPSIRQDINDLVRDESGFVSTSKIGMLIGQWLAITLILKHGAEIIANWDSLTVLFSVLVAPDSIKKLIQMKYGGSGFNGGGISQYERINYEYTPRTP